MAWRSSSWRRSLVALANRVRMLVGSDDMTYGEIYDMFK